MLGLESTGPNQVESDSDPFTYRNVNKDPDQVFNESEPLGNQRIGDSFTSLVHNTIKWDHFVISKGGPRARGAHGDLELDI